MSAAFRSSVASVSPGSGGRPPHGGPGPGKRTTRGSVAVAVVGAAGYAGGELAGLLATHPGVRLAGLHGSARRSDPVPFDELHPRWAGVLDAPVTAFDDEAIDALEPNGVQAVLLATPHEASHELVPRLLERGLVVLDLSGAYRLGDPALHAAAYGFEHEQPDLLASAVYGLVERRRRALRTADLVAVPGCYPTSVVLALAPLVDAGLLAPGGPVIADCISGISGAGRTPTERNAFCEVSVAPYGVLSHRHEPEIARHAGTEVLFVPHVGPYDRGIVSTIHAGLVAGADEAAVRAAWDDAYAGEPFVRGLPAGRWPSVAAVRGTNRCDLACTVREDRVVLVSALDNLLKGAAGQAIQCLNLRFDLPETAGLPGATGGVAEGVADGLAGVVA